MSASGNITADVIYAHSGNPEDYDWLEAQGIDPRGKIAIVRYSMPYSYRGFKAWEAERRGVAALIIYSDPRDDGYRRGEVFPHGPWGPESHIQRGAITYDFIVPGDPLTPGWPSIEGVKRITPEEARSVRGFVDLDRRPRRLQKRGAWAARECPAARDPPTGQFHHDRRVHSGKTNRLSVVYPQSWITPTCRPLP